MPDDSFTALDNKLTPEAELHITHTTHEDKLHAARTVAISLAVQRESLIAQSTGQPIQNFVQHLEDTANRFTRYIMEGTLHHDSET